MGDDNRTVFAEAYRRPRTCFVKDRQRSKDETGHMIDMVYEGQMKVKDQLRSEVTMG